MKPFKAFILRMLCRALPRTVRYGPVRIVLDPTDPVISVGLAFRFHERDELAFLNRAIRANMTVLDIGANVGLYSALAALAVGDAGRVVAFEPNPESFEYLRQTILENRLTNVTPVQMAASDQAGMARLYRSSSNHGDSRLYSHALSDTSVDVATVRLDDYLLTLGVQQVDFIKIDVQGLEERVLAGLSQTIGRSPRLTILCEFWPHGLRLAGTDPAELLDKIESLGFRISKLRTGGDTERISDKKAFVANLMGSNSPTSHVVRIRTSARWEKSNAGASSQTAHFIWRS